MNIPSDYQELERVYQNLPLNQACCIGVSAVNPQEGVSSLVDAIAARAHQVGKRVLVVDCNLHRPRQLSADGAWLLEQRPQCQSHSLGFDLLPAPLDLTTRQALRESSYFAQLLSTWKQYYDLILLDTSSLSRSNAANLPITNLLSACDGSVLCYLAGVTNAAQLKAAVTELQHQQALILGVVVNDQFNPGLQRELLRLSSRYTAFFPKISQSIRRNILNSPLLSLRV